MRKYRILKVRKMRPYVNDSDVKEDIFFWTAAGLLRFARKEAEYYPKDPRMSFIAYVKRRGEWVEIFSL